MDNKFQEFNDIDIISGNLTAFMSDHVPQFALTSNILGKNISSKSNIHERDWCKFEQEHFILD